MITQDSYSANLAKSEEDTRAMLETYLKEPTAENLHGLRTATRRMLTILKLVPSKARGGKSARLVKRFENLLDLTQKARHLDIVLSRVPSLDRNKGPERWVQNLMKKRDSSIQTAKRVASSLRNPSMTIQTRDLSDSALTKRFDRAAKKLTTRIQKMLQTVMDKSIREKQLHRLRQDSRKLRYLLELSGNQESSDKLSVLRTWQELLAAIHDSDATAKVLENNKKNAHVKILLDEVLAERTRNFEKFRQVVEERPLFNQSKPIPA